MVIVAAVGRGDNCQRAIDISAEEQDVSDTVKVILNRGSVAMGDDVESHVEFWVFPASATFDDLLIEISSRYLPSVGGPAGWRLYSNIDDPCVRRVLGLIYTRDDLKQEDRICRLIAGRRTLGELAKFSELDVYASYLTFDEARPVTVGEVKASASFTGCRPTKLESRASAQAKHAWWLINELDREASATSTVRREWIRDTLLTAASWPDGAEVFIARNFHFLTSLLCPVSMDIAGTLLGTDESLDDGLDSVPDINDRPNIATLAMILAAFEWGIRKESWRFGERQDCRVYLEFLATCGYPLSPIEHVMAGHMTVDEFLETEESVRERVERVGQLRNAQSEIRLNHYRGNTTHADYEAAVQPINAELTALGQHPGPPLGCCR
jgi:hypothetical protein